MASGKLLRELINQLAGGKAPKTSGEFDPGVREGILKALQDRTGQKIPTLDDTEIIEQVLPLFEEPMRSRIPSPATIPVDRHARGPGPTIDTLTPTESVGVAERRLNPFEEAAQEARELDPNIPSTQSKSVFDETPERGEALGAEALEEITPKDRVTRKGRNTLEEMDNLFGDEEARQVEEIRRILNERGITRSRIPTERDRAEVLNVARDVIRGKEVDQEAKKVFGKESGVGGLEDALDLSNIDSRVAGAPKINPKTGEMVDDQELFNELGQAKSRLQKFKREASQTTAKSREKGTPEPVQGLRDRLSGSRNVESNELLSLIKTLVLREARNRKTNQPTSTQQLKDRIRELGGTKEQVNSIRQAMSNRLKARGQQDGR